MKEELKKYTTFIHFLSETLGSAFEVTLFDMTEPDYPVIASNNSHKDIQEKLRKSIAQAAKNQRIRQNGYFANHPIQTDLSTLIKTSVFFIRDEAGEIEGALCISSRCDLFMNMLNFASDMIRMNTNDFDSDSWEMDEPDPVSAEEVSLDTITAQVREFGVDPERMSQSERLEIILDLYDMGVFDVKGAVAKTADELHISAQSVYRYITKIKKTRGW